MLDIPNPKVDGQERFQQRWFKYKCHFFWVGVCAREEAWCLPEAEEGRTVVAIPGDSIEATCVTEAGC